MFPPRRIVCLTEETVETLYLLGEDHRIVGVSGYAVRPPQVRKEKPRVAAFISADVPKILALEPDLVLTFSDLQADIVAELIRANVAVHAFNQRDIAGILAMIRTIGALVSAPEKADALATTLGTRVDAARAQSARFPRRPRVYFEEWDEPMISGIGWVSELVRRRRRHRRVPRAFRAQERQGPHRHAQRPSLRPSRTSSSAPGAARNSCRPRSPPGPALTGFPPSPAVFCTRSSPPSSCSRDRRPSPTDSMLCAESWPIGLKRRRRKPRNSGIFAAHSQRGPGRDMNAR